MDCVVDSYGRLHVFAEVMQSSEDNLSFFYEGYLVDLIWDGSDWSEIIIGAIEDLSSGPFIDATSAQNLYTHPQASITADGEVAIFSWSASPENDVNEEPDVYARAVNTVTGAITEIKNLTEDTDAAESVYYATTSPVLISGGDDYDYELPLVSFIDWNGDNLDPVSFYYFNGVGFDESEFVVSVDEVESPLIGLLLYPNPTKDQLRVSFGLNQEMETQMRIIDSTGRTMSELNLSDSNSGHQTYDIRTSDLATGRYTLEIITDKISTVRPFQVER